MAASSQENVQLEYKRSNDKSSNHDLTKPDIDEEIQLQGDEDSRPEKQITKRGLAFLKRKWTVPETATTCGLMFEVFGFVSTIYRIKQEDIVNIAVY